MDDEQDARAPSGSISRTLRVLAAMASAPSHGLGELSRATGLAKPTTLRLLRIMEEEGFVRRTGDGAWRLGTLLWELGCVAVDHDKIGVDALAVLRDLVDATGETVVYVVYDRGATVYVEQMPSPQTVRTSIAIGTRVDALDTATGRCMLAYQPPEEIERVLALAAERRRRRDGDDPGDPGDPGADDTAGARLRADLGSIAGRGYTYNRGGRWPGVWGMAAPVFDRRREVTGAVGVSGPTAREPADVAPVAAAVQRAASRITAIQGGVTPLQPA